MFQRFLYRQAISWLAISKLLQMNIYVSPGFINLHVNGEGGYDFIELSMRFYMLQKRISGRYNSHDAYYG